MSVVSFDPENHATPALLDYHHADADALYIPRATVAFAAGFLSAGISCNMLYALFCLRHLGAEKMVHSLMLHMAFVFGITAVCTSLLLVGLKIRDGHARTKLVARHCLNPLGTGAIFAAMVWIPWLVAERGVAFDRFLAAGIWMVLMAFPGLAALWVVGPSRAEATCR